MARRTALEIVEDLATTVHGRGTAISLDRERGEWVARVWSARGWEIGSARAIPKSGAINLLRAELRRREKMTSAELQRLMNEVKRAS